MLDDKQQVIPYASEAFATKRLAVARARFINQHGGNVQVLREHAHCVRG